MKKTTFFPGVALAALIGLPGCAPQLLGPEKPNTPVASFDHLWQEYDRMYGTFDVKKIDWQAAYDRFRPQVTEQTTDADLHRIMTQLLDVLDDNHVYLRPTAETKLPWYAGGILSRVQVRDYDPKTVGMYLKEPKTYGNDLVYGRVAPTIGYVRLKGFENNISYYPKAMDSVLTTLKDTKGLILDLRDNGGGEDRVAQYIANRFASEKHLSFTYRVRSGPRHTDFGPELRFYTEPKGDFQYTRPVILLVNRSVFSAGETFALAMLQNKQVRMLGDTTGGAFPDAIPRELPNGWTFRVPIADVRDAGGKSWEGVGLPPHVYVRNKPEDVKAGRDVMLETAIRLLQ